VTIHYGGRSNAKELPKRLSFLGDLRPGLALYTQTGATYLPGDKSTSPTVSITGVAALEQKEDEPATTLDLSKPPDNPYIPSLTAVVLNPTFSYTGEGQLTQGPNLSNLYTVGGTLGLQLGFGDQFSLLAEGNVSYETGSALRPSDQSASAMRYTAGLVATYSWLGHGTEAQSNSVAFGAWFFHESGTVGGTSVPGSPTGSFNTNGVVIGISTGYRSPAVLK